MPARFLFLAAWFVAVIVAGPVAAQVNAPAAEEVPLVTRDGVQLKATYYPSTKSKGTPEAKQVTPVVLLHDYKSTRAALGTLAQRLQVPAEDDPKRPAFAVVTVDLRAHGDSIRQMFPDGSAVDLDASRLRREDYVAMAAFDMEAVRSFLVGKNDEGELNLNKLCLLGSGMGSNVAANWALKDWTAPPLAIGKQGQDVKAIVLVSPSWSFNGLTFQAPMRFRPLKANVAWLLMCGAEDTKARADLQRIYKQLERFHPDASDAASRKSSSLAVIEWPSTLQADVLVKQLGTSVEDQILKFLYEQVASRQHPWLNRRGRLP